MIPSPDRQATAFRADVQGLRALAVGLVVVFHLFPTVLTGGYVGVDVFFVISGYLISGLLVRRAERDGRVDFRDFYIRRARRLLPAACLVLIVTGLAGWLIMPRTLLPGLGREIVASAFYFENFRLYFQGRDYLAADAAPSPLQHYWSLSIEEQFYIVWPVAIALGLWLATKTGRAARPVLFVILLVITAASLLWSIQLTPRDPGAYFLTTTRVWELALGGLLALASPWLSLPATLRLALRWLGVAMIMAAGVLFTEATVFPGFAALLPTLGTLFLLLPKAETQADPAVLLERKPAIWLGDISYSLYLWHWPVIILGGYLVARGGGDASHWAPWQYAAALALMLGLSHLSKYGIEDRFRHAGRAPRPGRRALGLSLACLGATSGVALALIAPSLGGERAPTLAEMGDHPGAAVYIPGAPEVAEKPFIPTLDRALQDFPSLYAMGCQLSFEDDEPAACTFGKPDGAKTLVLIGDSHAGQYLPALEAWADGRDVRILTHTKSSCPFVDGAVLRGPGDVYQSCVAWNAAVMDRLLADPPDLVVTGKFSSTFLDGETGETNDPAVVAGLTRHWSRLLDAGIPVMALAHTPRFPQSVPDCLSAPGATVRGCEVARSEAYRRTAHMRLAADAVPGARLADMNPWICPEGYGGAGEGARCPVITGNVLVYRDPHHLTATYSATLAPMLGRQLDEALGLAAP